MLYCQGLRRMVHGQELSRWAERRPLAPVYHEMLVKRIAVQLLEVLNPFASCMTLKRMTRL